MFDDRYLERAAGALRDVADRFARAMDRAAREIRERFGFDELEREFEEHMRHLRSHRLSVEERERLATESRRAMALAGRPRLVARQYVRPRWVRRACGSRHRVMLP